MTNTPAIIDEKLHSAPPRVLLLGEPGTGKTYSSALAGRYRKLRYIFTENSIDTLYYDGPGGLPADIRARVGKTIHYAYCPGASVESGLNDLINMATNVAQLDFTGMQNLAADRTKTREYIKLAKLIDEFRADNGGESFGKIGSWGPDVCLVLDSLSGFNTQCQRLTVGAKPIMSQPQWQIAMNMQMMLLNQLLMGAPCGIIVTAHMEQELNEVDGTQRNYPSALGKKNGPSLGRFFTEVIECTTKGEEFGWRTMSSRTQLKTRRLPRVAFMPPSWDIIFGKEKLP